MNKYLLGQINFVVAGLAGLFFLLALWFFVSRPSEISLIEEVGEKAALPKGAFELEVEDYEAIGPPLLSLNYSPMTLQLPNLARHIVYYGKNERPDANISKPAMHFSFLGSKEIVSSETGEPLYLIYDESQTRSKYKFSPENAETSLWIDAVPQEKEAIISVAMRNEAGEIIRQPEANAEFVLKERKQPRSAGDEWKLEEFRVDGTILARQKARWYGMDKFLEKHGGEEYKEYSNKQRIDFGSKDEKYSVFIGPEGALAWIDGRWKEVSPGVETLSYPILVTNKVDGRLMKLELWDVEGERKVSLNLIKSSESWLPDKYLKEFKFVAARTRSQYVFEIKKDRITLSPQDWLVRTKEGWRKISTAQDIDDYVERKILGPLFIFDGVAKKDGKQVIFGTLFNESRTKMQQIELPMQQGATAEASEKRKTSPLSRPAIQRRDANVEREEPEGVGKEVLDGMKMRFLERGGAEGHPVFEKDYR